MLTLRGSRGPRCGAALQDLGLISDGALLIRDGVLAEVGTTRRVENLAAARDAVEINAAGRVVMPGFIDSHTHLVIPPPGFEEESENARLVRATAPHRIEMRARAFLQAMARHGTTTVEVKTGCGPDVGAETKLLRAISALKREPLDLVPTFLFRAERVAESASCAETDLLLHDALPKIRRRGLARFADIAWGRVPERLAGADFFDAVRRAGLPCKVHADQPAPTAAVRAAVEHFATSIDHLEHIGPSDAALLAGSCTIATLLPCGSLEGKVPDAPARALIDAGVPVALASDFNPRYAPTLSMQTVVSLACLRLRMKAEEAIAAATVNAAHALGRGDVAGSLEPGKAADVLILNASDYREAALRVGMNLVHMTMKRGEFIYEEGEVGRRDARGLAPRPSFLSEMRQ